MHHLKKIYGIESFPKKKVSYIFLNFREFGDLAMGVLNECFEADEKKTNLLLIRRHEQFGDANCLKLAIKSDNKQFISHPACQDFFRNVWMGNLALENGTFRVGYL